MTTTAITKNLQRLLDERAALWESDGKPLATIAETRALTKEEAERFAEVERAFKDKSARIDELQALAEQERSLSPLLSGITERDAASARRWYNRDNGEAADVRASQSFASHPVVQRAASRANDTAAIDQYGNLGNMIRALSTTGGGSAVIPASWSSDLIDLARSNAAVTQAGATVIPMDAKTVNIGRITSDPTAAFRAENSTIAASDPGIDSVVLTAKTMNTLVIGSLEWFEDTENGERIIAQAIAEAMARQLDRVALYGGITAGAGTINLPLLDGSSNPQNPRGILAALNATKPANVLGAATNGTTQTAATYWNEIIDLLFTVRDNNEEPGALIWNSKAGRQYAKAYDTTGQPLQMPTDVAAVQRLTSNSIPSYTQGTMTGVATDVFAGDFTQLLIGQRLGITINVLTERYAENGQIGIVATWRGDVALARPGAFSVYKAIKGA